MTGKQALPFDILALDVDGTICDYASNVDARTKRAVRDIEARGATIVIATGRRWPTAIKAIEPLEAGTYLIQSNGAVVRRIADKAVLHDSFIPNKTAIELIDLCRKHGVIGVWFDTPGRSHKLFVDGDLSGNRQLQLYASSNPTAFVPLDGFHGLADAMQLVVFGDEHRLTATVADLDSGFSEDVRFIPWRSARLGGLVLEVLALDASKGTSLRWLASELGVARQRVTAIGDDINDVEMLQWAGTGIAMGNATDPAKAAADLQIGPIDEGGLPAYLESLL